MSQEQTGIAIEQQPSMFAALWRYKWYIIVAALLAAAIAYGVSSLRSPLYSAEGTVLLADPASSEDVADEVGLVLDPRRYVPNQVKIIESPQVAQRAAENLADGSTTTDVQNATAATPAVDLGAIAVTGIMPTASEAVAVVDAVVGAYEEITAEQVQNAAATRIETLETSKAETRSSITELDALIAANPGDSALEAQRTAAVDQFVALDTRIELLATNAALYGSGVQIYVAPTTPTAPFQPQPKRNAAIGFVFGALITGVWAWWRAERNQVADHRDVPARVIDAPLLASVPDYRFVNATGPAPTITDPSSAATEAYQFALSSLGFALEGIKGRTVLVTSTSQGDGKTSTALNLAIAAAHDGRSPLLIDGDERVRGLTTLAGLEEGLGISDLNGPGSNHQVTHRWMLVDGTQIDIVPAGTGVTGSTASYFRSEGFRAAFPSLLNGHDIVIIDSPPVMAAAETTDLAAAVDGIVLVIAEGAPLSELIDARQRLAMSGTPIVGYVFNRATSKSNLYGYGYGYGYGGKGSST